MKLVLTVPRNENGNATTPRRITTAEKCLVLVGVLPEKEFDVMNRAMHFLE